MVRCLLAIPHTPKPARLAISAASTVISHRLASRPRKLNPLLLAYPCFSFDGKIDTRPRYVDLYASTKQGLGSFLGNRSINIHSSNTTRLTCASFVLTTGGSNGTSTNSTNTTSSTSPPIASFTGGAATNFAAGTAVVGLLVVGLAFLM